MALTLLISTVLLIFVVNRIVGAWKLLRSVGYLSGRRTVLGFESILFHILPQIPGINLGKSHIFDEKHTIFEGLQCDAYALVNVWPKAALGILIADATAIKDICSTRRFPKPVEQYEAISVYGPNIVAAEGNEWKKYRKISAPSFSEKNTRLVWEETLRIVDDLIENIWKNKDATVDHGVDITLSLALLVIGAAGFGQRVSWGEDANVVPGNHQMAFREALHITASNLVLNFVVPDWLKSFHPKLRKLRLANDELKMYMREMIKDRQGSGVLDQYDLFSSLIRANNEELDGISLTEEELMGNIFIFLVAGHETTAHTLAFTFALLALYPDVQKKLFEHIRAVLPNGKKPAYDDIPKLTYVFAVYNETLRMFPPVSALSKLAPEDTSIMVGNSVNEETKRIPIPKGTELSLHIPGVHYNPRYWENPYEFIPERFLKDWNRDAFVAFSAGPRACLGRKFNETEGIAALTSIISRYQVEIQDEPQFNHETFQERRARILKAEEFLTLAPKRLPLYFRRRTD